MDVSSISRVSRGFAQYATQAKNANSAKSGEQAGKSGNESAKVGDAFDLEISDAAKQAQSAKKSEELSVEGETQQTKGLSAEKVDELKADLETQQQTMLNIMIQALTESNDKLQGWLDAGTGILNFGGVKIDAARFALPEVATNPEDAAKAIAPGGAWSVDAVSTRIFDLASAIAGNDPEKLAEMRSAVEEGFKQAGLEWNKATGQDKMPDITKQTYTEIMNRFDKRANELNGTSIVE